MTRALSSLRTLFHRSWELLVLAAGHGFAALFLSNLATGLREIDDPSVRQLAGGVHGFFFATFSGNLLLRLAMVLLVLLLLGRALRGRSIRFGCDVLGALLSLRCALQLLLLNLLLLAPLKSGGLLLVQLVLFLPVITIDFGWLYWRFDSGRRRRGLSHIRFDEEPPQAFDYFHAAANALLQFDPSGAKAITRPMKALFVLHGVVMMDLVALTLSRAIGLASSR
jgi:hypothetical protein